MNSNLTKANDFYKMSQQETGLSAVLRRSYLERAIKMYTEEIKTAKAEFYPPLWKNLGLTNFRIAEILDPKFDLAMIMHYLADAVRALSIAWSGKSAEQNVEWCGRVEELIFGCFERAFTSLDRNIEKFFLLSKVVSLLDAGLGFDCFRIRFHLAKVQYFYRCGVAFMEGNDFKTTKRLVEYAREEVECALKYCCGKKNGPFLADIKDLQDDVAFLGYSCESVRLRVQADDLFDTHVNQSEEINFDMMWDILDLYKAAGMNGRDRDIENEAISLARQGRLFDKIFQIRSKAHLYYRAAFDLGVSLHPRDVTRLDWFIESKEAIQRFQEEVVREEEEKKEREKIPYLAKMTEILMELKRVHDLEDPFKILHHVYTKHPPKVAFEYEQKDIDSLNIKKCIMKAITQYHPDKQINYDMEWRILAEEITKCLTVRYERLKM